MKDYPLVVVRWRDSANIGHGKWIDLEDADKYEVMLCQSVGWLVHEDENRIILASHLTDTEQGSGVMMIPMEFITEHYLLPGGD